MKCTLKKLVGNLWASTKGGVNLIGTTISVVMLAALVPTIVLFITTAKDNLTATEGTLLGLVVLFLVVGLVYGVIKSSGLANHVN